VKRVADRRPHILYAKPDKDREGDRLPDKRHVDIHRDVPLTSSWRPE